MRPLIIGTVLAAISLAPLSAQERGVDAIVRVAKEVTETQRRAIPQLRERMQPALGRLARAVQRLADFAPDHPPTTPEDWETVEDAARGLAGAVKDIGGLSGDYLHRFLGGLDRLEAEWSASVEEIRTSHQKELARSRESLEEVAAAGDTLAALLRAARERYDCDLEDTPESCPIELEAKRDEIVIRSRRAEELHSIARDAAEDLTRHMSQFSRIGQDLRRQRLEVHRARQELASTQLVLGQQLNHLGRLVEVERIKHEWRAVREGLGLINQELGRVRTQLARLPRIRPGSLELPDPRELERSVEGIRITLERADTARSRLVEKYGERRGGGRR